jgi:hypothetical protein
MELKCHRVMTGKNRKKTYSVRQLTAFSLPPAKLFSRRPDYFPHNLTDGRSGRIFCRSIILQELVHCLQGLVIFV